MSFRTLLQWRHFHTPVDLLLFVPLFRHLPSSSPSHPSTNICLAFPCFFGLSLLLFFINFLQYLRSLCYVQNSLLCCFLITQFRTSPNHGTQRLPNEKMIGSGVFHMWLKVHQLWIGLLCVQSFVYLSWSPRLRTILSHLLMADML